MSRILYFCPDFPQPSGGVKTLYRHVNRLRQLGWEAYIVHQRHGFVLDWHGYQAPVLWLEDKPTFGAEDVLVFPEVMSDQIRQTAGFGGRRAVIALSWAPAYARLRPGERWQDAGITHVMTKSPLIKRFLAWSMDLNVTLVAEYVDPALYFYQPTAKRRQVCYLTRKDQTGAWLQGVINRKHQDATGCPWLPLREMSEAVYAQHLRQSGIFLTTTTQEGMHVSVLEAMACGCLVVDYAGVGGHEYMVGEGAGQNCILVENGNLPVLGETLERVLLDDVRHHDGIVYDGIVANAVATARPYQDAAAEMASLKRFFEQVMRGG
jgi:glycosyltransferase involved in cell wall biosynthesis